MSNLDSVADPDPGSGAFLTPGSGIRDGYEFRIRNPGCSVADPFIFLPGSADISLRSADPLSVLLIQDVYPASRSQIFPSKEMVSKLWEI